MALSDPLPVAEFADKLKIASVKWMLREHQEISGLGSGQILVANIAPPLWTAEVELAPMPNEEAAEVQGLVESLDGGLRSFYLYAPQKIGPAYDPDGSILSGSTPKIYALDANNKEMRVYGLPAGYKLTAGDFIAFDYGSNPSRRALHRVLNTVAADGSGITPAFEVRPYIRAGAQTDINVTLVKPAAKVGLIPESFDPGTVAPVATAGMRFSVIQRIP